MAADAHPGGHPASSSSASSRRLPASRGNGSVLYAILDAKYGHAVTAIRLEPAALAGKSRGWWQVEGPARYF